ncbi:hypothetical protein SAMN05519103_01925 [Rhizobiales bacterium GAS113]|nr:hypothetical protein SAMN05519103_01925 [Rhizobiales bacterium GAS113]
MLRSAITNGTAILAGVDHRAPEMRRLRDLIALHVSDLGGQENVSHAEAVLVRRASMLTLQIELMETGFAEHDFEATRQQLETYQRAANTLRRLLETLGLQRRPRHATPTLSEYLKGKQRPGEGIPLEAAE